MLQRLLLMILKNTIQKSLRMSPEEVRFEKGMDQSIENKRLYPIFSLLKKGMKTFRTLNKNHQSSRTEKKCFSSKEKIDKK